MTATDWTEEKIKRMTALWVEGVSASAIARELGDGATRSAVLGKLRRLEVHRTNAHAPRRGAAPARRSRTGRRARPAAPTAAPPDAPARRDPPQATALPLSSLMSVRHGACRWPFGDPGGGDLAVCGREVGRGAYCALHAGMAYQSRRQGSLFALAGISED